MEPKGGGAAEKGPKRLRVPGVSRQKLVWNKIPPPEARFLPFEKKRKRPELVVVKLPFTVRDGLDEGRSVPESDDESTGSKGPLKHTPLDDKPWRESIQTKILSLVGGTKVLANKCFRARNYQAGDQDVGPPVYFQPETRGSTSHSTMIDNHREPVVVRVRRAKASGRIKSAEIIGVAERFFESSNTADYVFRGPSMFQPMFSTDSSLILPDEPGPVLSTLHKLPQAMQPLLEPENIKKRKVEDYTSSEKRAADDFGNGSPSPSFFLPYFLSLFISLSVVFSSVGSPPSFAGSFRNMVP